MLQKRRPVEMTPTQIRQLLAAMETQGNYNQTRADILIHAMNVFVRRGLERTTVQDLLNEADVSRRTFYKYFRNKQDVLETLYQLFVTNMVMQFRQQVRLSDDIASTIRQVVHIYVSHHANMGPIIALLMEEARHANSRLAPLRDNAYAMVTDMLQRTIARQTDRKVDQLALLALLWDLENFSLYLANQNYDEGECRKVERIMEGLCCAVALGQAGEGVLLREADKG